MSMTENQQIGQVQVQQQENYILFTDKEGTTFYRTGMMPDDNLTQRLYDSGAEFNGEIIEQTDPWITVLISWVLPIVIFIALGQYLSKKMMKNAGGPNSRCLGWARAMQRYMSSHLKA